MTEAQVLLKYGSHDDNNPDCCAVEYAHVQRGMAKEAKALPDESDVMVRALIGFSDSFPASDAGDADRTKYLLPLAARLAGSRGSIEVEIKRSFMAADWLIRAWAPMMMGDPKETREHAAALRSLPEITSAENLNAALPLFEKSARAALAALAARAALAALDALDALAALAALDALAARAALDALAARAARAADPSATEDQRYQAAVAAAERFYAEAIAAVRASEVVLLNRMFDVVTP